MKRSIAQTARPLTWNIAEQALQRAIAADTCDDRVSEEFYDEDEERAAVEALVNKIDHHEL